MRLSFLAIPLLLLGCAASSNTIGGAIQTGDATYSSTGEYDVDITQIAAPTLAGQRDGQPVIQDVRFRIDFTNRGTQPVRITRISLQSMGGSMYRLETSTRSFEKTLSVGEKTSFEYWAKATVENPTMGTRAPLVVRALIDTVVSGSESQETFNREVNQGAVMGVTSNRS